MNENYNQIDRLEYLNKLGWFWLGVWIADWTCLITEIHRKNDIWPIPKTNNK